MKRFVDVDAIDVEIDLGNLDAFCPAAQFMRASFGGTNLKDIKAH